MKTILVTGANRGIGFGIAKALAGKHRVILGTRDIALKEQLTLKLPENVLIEKLDITSENDIENLANTIKNKFNKLDVLINNAGIISENNQPSTIQLSEVKRVMDTNFFGTWSLSQKMIPFLKNSAEAQIINISSGMGALNDLSGNYAAYRISKSALNALTIMLANELAGKIKVNAVCPG